MDANDKQAKAIALSNSRHLNRHLWSTDPAVDAAVREIYEVLANADGFSGNKTLWKKHLKVIVLNLYAVWLADPERYVAFSRDRTENSRIPDRYNMLRLTHLLVDVVDALRAADFIEHHKGHHDRTGGFYSSHLSRMRATDTLIAFLRDIPRDAIVHYGKAETIILRERDAKGRNKDIDYQDNRLVQRMRKKVKDYNALLATTELALLDAPSEGVPNKAGTDTIKLDFRDKFVRRIFNNGSWDEGGRFYGGWWQRIGSDWRVRISFNGGKEGATEIDYSGLHIVILYAQEGIDYWKKDGIDPYKLDGYEASERMRTLLKLILLVAINAKGKKPAIAAVKKETNFDPDEYGWVDFDVSDLIEAFAERHAPIAKHFYSGAGVRLQRIDADIAEKVIYHFLKDGIPVLCVHDSFVIDHAHSNRLIQQMETALVDVMSAATGGKVPDIKPLMKPKTYWDMKMKEMETEDT